MRLRPITTETSSLLRLSQRPVETGRKKCSLASDRINSGMRTDAVQFDELVQLLKKHINAVPRAKSKRRIGDHQCA